MIYLKETLINTFWLHRHVGFIDVRSSRLTTLGIITYYNMHVLFNYVFLLNTYI